MVGITELAERAIVQLVGGLVREQHVEHAVRGAVHALVVVHVVPATPHALYVTPLQCVCISTPLLGCQGKSDHPTPSDSPSRGS